LAGAGLILNGLSGLAVAAMSLMLALKLKKEKGCVIRGQFYFLTFTFLLLSLLNILWFFSRVDISEWDRMFIAPLFNLVFVAVWFYTGLAVSGHRRIYYIVPLFMMSINVALILNGLSIFSDILSGFMIAGIFFYIGVLHKHVARSVGWTGIAYGLLVSSASISAYFLGTGYMHLFMVVPNIALFSLLLMIFRRGHTCALSGGCERSHTPMIVEVMKFGFFIVVFTIFLMLGTLGTHELGHSLAAKTFGCTHETVFGIGRAVTHVSCDDGDGRTVITLGGLILTVFVSLSLFLAGNDFARKMSLLLLALSVLVSIDDFSALGLPDSMIVSAVFVSMFLISYGLFLIVNQYGLEYDTYEASIDRPGCGRKDLNS